MDGFKHMETRQSPGSVLKRKGYPIKIGGSKVEFKLRFSRYQEGARAFFGVDFVDDQIGLNVS